MEDPMTYRPDNPFAHYRKPDPEPVEEPQETAQEAEDRERAEAVRAQEEVDQEEQIHLQETPEKAEKAAEEVPAKPKRTRKKAAAKKDPGIHETRQFWPMHSLGRSDLVDHVDDQTGAFDPTLIGTLAAAFSGPDHPNDSATYPRGLFPPTWPVWRSVKTATASLENARDRVVAGVPLTEEVVETGHGTMTIRTYDPAHPLVASWLQAADDAQAAFRAAEREALYAKHYRDGNGLDWLTLLRDRADRDRITQAADATNRWKDSVGLEARPLPSLDDDADRPWLIDGILPAGGLALVVGAAGVGKSSLVAELARAVSTDEAFLGAGAVLTDEVVIIDTDTPPSVLAARYAPARDMGAVILPFRGRATDLDVRDPNVRAWLARAIPAGALVIVDSLPTLLGVLDVQETTADAGGYLSAWNALVTESGAAGLVIVHASPANDGARPRGHGSIGQVADSIWTVKSARGRATLTVDGRDMDFPRGADSAAPAKPEEVEEEAPVDPPVKEKKPSGYGVRERIMDHVIVHAGNTTTQVAEGVGVSLPTAGRHLKVLLEEGRVETSVGVGKTTFWFPAPVELQKG